jgi:carboxyl-terminal processing protease
MKIKQNSTEHTLNLKQYKTEQHNNKKEEDRFKEEEKEIHGWNFEALKLDKPALVADSVKANRSTQYIKSLKKDAYIFEAIQVIKDIRKQ